jgi:hypothetical protein
MATPSIPKTTSSIIGIELLSLYFFFFLVCAFNVTDIIKHIKNIVLLVLNTGKIIKKDDRR